MYFGKRSFHCIMHVVKLVSKPVTIYISSKARPLQLFQMFAEISCSKSPRKNISLTRIFCQTNFLLRYRYFRDPNVGELSPPKFLFRGASAPPAPPLCAWLFSPLTQALLHFKHLNGWPFRLGIRNLYKWGLNGYCLLRQYNTILASCQSPAKTLFFARLFGTFTFASCAFSIFTFATNLHKNQP